MLFRSSFRDAENQILNNTGPTASIVLNAMLSNATIELFLPYIEGQRYMEKENKSLVELYLRFLERFALYHVR